MPGTTGLDVLAEAREIDAEVPVILMTAQASLQSAVRAVNEGAYYYLQKPFEFYKLRECIERGVQVVPLPGASAVIWSRCRFRHRPMKTPPIGRRARRLSPGISRRT